MKRNERTQRNNMVPGQKQTKIVMIRIKILLSKHLLVNLLIKQKVKKKYRPIPSLFEKESNEVVDKRRYNGSLRFRKLKKKLVDFFFYQ